MIFITENIGKNGELIAFLDEAHGDTGTGAFSGTPASISASDVPQTVAIEEEPLDSVISDTTRSVYGNSVLAGSIG
jgi:hypothetical protein